MTLQLSIPSAPGEVAGLAVRLDEPPGPGAGFTVLYMHGMGSSQAGEKAAYFRRRFGEAGAAFCSFDFRGHGESHGAMRELSLTRNLEDALVVRRELERRGHRRFVVVGSSMGALTALWHAALHPNGVAALLGIAPALGLDDAFAGWLGEEGMERWRRDGVLAVENELGSWELGWGFVEDLRRHDIGRLASSYRAPGLLLQGMLDDRVSWRRVADFAAGSSSDGLELHLFADGDHRLVDRLDHLWSLMRGFLEARLGAAVASAPNS